MAEVIHNKVAFNSRVVIHNKEVTILPNSHNKLTEVNQDITDNHNRNLCMFNNHKKVAVVRVQERVAVLVWLVLVYVVAQKRCVSIVSSKNTIISFRRINLYDINPIRFTLLPASILTRCVSFNFSACAYIQRSISFSCYRDELLIPTIAFQTTYESAARDCVNIEERES
ncbi:uncharacterized protein FA14DRAFT_12730 [Meira miltonrushii]|uniref:Uncharacterized protein n=1 Tax=Meira miltonrushii TaxID=1280837 RepID=A0A316VIF9_9BASI|nr:uncharacterized protein FA14DRAFT_12730 [Meira miltonrushii]PWN37290.1 hypothetical protein FA14DRAFT_12730 [Meira miltonrushii]